MKTERLNKIKTVLQELKLLYPFLDKHTIKPIQESDLQDFENEHSIQLPNDYRQFLMTFGDEAILPHVFQKKSLSLQQSVKNEIWKSFKGPLSEPFRYTGNQPIAIEKDEQQDDYVRTDHLNGTLCLGSGGCDIIWILVVNGKEKGKVWMFVPGLEHELNPTNLEFLDWCLDGLENMLSRNNE